jgi:hypothetical protein
MRNSFAALLLFVILPVFPPQRLDAQEGEAGFYVERNGEGFRFIQRFSWEPEEYASSYEVRIEKRENAGGWAAVLSELTENNFIEVSLPPGSYRYRVQAYDLMEKPAGNPEWISFEILAALRPVLEAFSPKQFPLDGAALILTVRGRGLAEAAEFRLVREGPAGRAEILPRERRGEASGEILVFGGDQLSPGNYELRVLNPGGLEDSLGTLRTYLPETVSEFYLSAGYGPLVPLYGGLRELLEASFYPAGAYGQFSFLPVQRVSVGLEIDLYWTRLSTRYNSGVQSYDVSGHYLGIEVYGLLQKTLGRYAALNLRLGGGLFSILGFEKTAPGHQTEEVNALIPSAGGGLSFRLFFLKSFFAELGAEYTHFFSADDSPPGYLRPFGGLGFSW